MLARLLRNILLSQLLLGAVLGAAWSASGGQTWSAVLLALATPLLLLMLTVGVTALRAHARAEPATAWWLSLWGETLASVQVFLLRQPWARVPAGVQLPSAGMRRMPVVLVHGFMCNHRIWDDAKAALLAAGHPVIAVDLEPLLTSIDHYAATIEAAVLGLQQNCGSAKVALIGHSMGGLAIRAWMRQYGTERVAQAITLGTPHSGTRAAILAVGANASQMQWQSPWLAALSAAETAQTRALFTVALTPQDNIVYPQRAQTLQGIAPVVFEGIGHLQMCLHPPLIAWLLQCLDNRPVEGKPA